MHPAAAGSALPRLVQPRAAAHWYMSCRIHRACMSHAVSESLLRLLPEQGWSHAGGLLFGSSYNSVKGWSHSVEDQDSHTLKAYAAIATPHTYIPQPTQPLCRSACEQRIRRQGDQGASCGTLVSECALLLHIPAERRAVTVKWSSSGRQRSTTLSARCQPCESHVKFLQYIPVGP